MKRFRIGILGTGRGSNIAKNLMHFDECEVVAMCDCNSERLKIGIERLGNEIATYNDFDKFIEHGLDAVVIANNFHQHTPYIIKCFERNIHVFCECISNATMAEGVALVRAFEKSSSVFFLGENYPQMLFNREIKKVCDSKTLGTILYAEGEYNHPYDTSLSTNESVDFIKNFIYTASHWRNYLPASYYITHSLGPLMHATGATPKTVTAFAAFAPPSEDSPAISNVGDKVAIITTQNDDGSIFRVTGSASFGAHHNAYRVCGTKGQIENLRGIEDKIMLRYNAWDIPDGMNEVNFYTPEINDKDEDKIKESGHGGSDYLTARMFVDCLKTNKQPEHPFNIYSSVNMSSVAILAHRSILEGGKPYEIPDFRKEEDRIKYENDSLTPFIGENDEEPTLPCCSHTDYKPTDEQIAKYIALIK